MQKISIKTVEGTTLEILSHHLTLAISRPQYKEEHPCRLSRVRELIMLLTQTENFVPSMWRLNPHFYIPEHCEGHGILNPTIKFCVFNIHKVVIVCSVSNNTTINQCVSLVYQQKSSHCEDFCPGQLRDNLSL